MQDQIAVAGDICSVRRGIDALAADLITGTASEGLFNRLAAFFYGKIVRRANDGGSLISYIRRFFAFAELDEFVTKVASREPHRPFAALAEALDIRFEFEGLENLQSVDGPAILFGNHPTGGGNVLGMLLLLDQHFADYRILGNRHMKFLGPLSDSMIPVDPFRSCALGNLDALAKLRREFGTQYQALGVFPAGISSLMNFLRGTISDRPWSDAFVRMAQQHRATLVPVWFSGRNRLRYYIAARIRKELGFLALPAEFLNLRGKTITVKIGRPISPNSLQHLPGRQAKLNFLRAATYALGDEHALQTSAAKA